MAAVQEDFFSFLAREFPTLCLHDEFVFFPRVSAAWEHWFQLPHLESGFLESAAARLAGLLSRLPRLAPEEAPGALAEEAVLLRQSLESVRRELGPAGCRRPPVDDSYTGRGVPGCALKSGGPADLQKIMISFENNIRDTIL